MKNKLKLAALSIILVSAISCKKETKTKDTIVEEVTEIGLPNESDIHFDEAITALESNNHKAAAMHLDKGVESLRKEGKKLKNKSKSILDKSISQLIKTSKALKGNKKIEINKLQEAIANAEIAIGHEYLISDDIYVLTPPKKADDKIIIDAFTRNLKSLESTTKKLENDKDNPGHKLLKEGKELEKQYDEWKSKVEEHVKKTNKHFKEFHSEHHYPVD